MSPIEAADIALVQVAGLEVLADLDDNAQLVDACHVVLDGLLDVRIHLPQQRTSPEGARPCTGTPSLKPAPRPS